MADNACRVREAGVVTRPVMARVALPWTCFMASASAADAAKGAPVERAAARMRPRKNVRERVFMGPLFPDNHVGGFDDRDDSIAGFQIQVVHGLIGDG